MDDDLQVVAIGVDERRISVAPNGAFGLICVCHNPGQKVPRALLERSLGRPPPQDRTRKNTIPNPIGVTENPQLWPCLASSRHGIKRER